MPRLSKGLILPGIRTYNGTEEAELHIFGSQGKQKGRSVTSMAERKSGTSAIWQSWPSGSVEAEFHIFFFFLAIKAECKRVGRISDLWQSRQSRSAEAELHIFGSPGRDEMRKWTFASLEVLVEKVRKRNLRSFEVLRERKFGKPNFTSLPVKAERKYGSKASDL